MTQVWPEFDSLIFDLDGTLWDATAAVAKAWSKFASDHQLSVKIDEAAIRSISGLPLPECIEVLFGSQGQNIQNFSELLEKSERQEIERSGGILYPGVREGLEYLSKSHRIYLVSNCPTWYMNSFFEKTGLQKFFQAALCFGQTARPKNENILRIIETNKLKKPVYIGDTHWDQHSAFSAGVKFIFAQYGFGKVSISCPSVKSFSELVSSLSNKAVVPEFRYQKLPTQDLALAQQFYQSVGYTQTAQPEDQYFAAFIEKMMVGLVRLAKENDCWVLRGMQIRSEFQFIGIGTKLIRLLASAKEFQTCFCMPHAWLENFYGQIGFKKIEAADEVPMFLRDRLLSKIVEYPQLILMKRIP